MPGSNEAAQDTIEAAAALNEEPAIHERKNGPSRQA